MGTVGLTVVLSDFHAGAAESLLTVLDASYRPDPAQVSPTTQAFAAAFVPTIKALASRYGKPDLVLLGDVLDLSLGRPEDAARIFAGFVKAIGVGGLFGTIAFVPGNHDHALWTAERYGATAGAAKGPGDAAFWAHSSPAFKPPTAMGTTTLLNAILAAGGVSAKVATYYPNMGLLPQTAEAGAARRLAVLHHGHFIESAYSAMSSLLAAMRDKAVVPMTAERIEKENGSWIDFVWSTLGDDGRVGAEVTLAEELMVTGGASYALQGQVAGMLARQVQAGLGLPVSGLVETWTNRVCRGVVDAVLGSYADLERFDYESYLSSASVDGLQSYLTQVVAAQLAEEVPDHGPGDHLTFIFGHTHKAFADALVVEGFTAPVSVYNSGGWVLDTADLSTVEGAGVVFLDDALNSAMVQVYGLTGGEAVHPAQVISADPQPDERNPLFQAVQKAVTANAAAWGTFSTTVAAELRKKQDFYMALGDRVEARAARKPGVA
ncbi:hypothetical protein C0V75_03210 [Tabrizicola sp. TH137]|nr:hypothetical protein C0V75_03210 [Tabrizicola sp. TH137]